MFSFLLSHLPLQDHEKKNLDLPLFDADGTRSKKLLLPNGGLQKKHGDFIPWDRICKKIT